MNNLTNRRYYYAVLANNVLVIYRSLQNEEKDNEDINPILKIYLLTYVIHSIQFKPLN